MAEAKFVGLGWNVRLQQKGKQYFLTLAKEVAIGNALQKGDPINYYFVECENRKAILVYLDGDPRPDGEIIKLRGVSFMLKK